MSVMQGFERADRQLLDAAALAGHLVPAGSMFAFLAAHRAEVFPDADYADLFSAPGVGRPSLPATQMAAVLTLQALHDYSDRETAEAVRFDVRWKAAIGTSLDDPGFDPSSLVYWRKRLAKSARPHRVNDAVKTVIEQTGILNGRRRRAVDSTILADAVATQDTVTQLVSAIRQVGREVPGAAEQIAAVCAGHDYSKPGKPKIDWDDPEAKEALVSALVNDANALVAALAGAELEEPAASAVALLALVAGQDVEPAEGSDGRDGRWRIARKVAEDRVVSTVDPETRHTRKSPEARRDGYRAHVAADPETGIITDEKLTKASGQENSDPAVAAEFLAAEPAGTGSDAAGDRAAGNGGDDALAWYGDSAYGTGELRDAIAAAGQQAVIKPKPVQPAVPGGFTVDDFTVDEQARTVTCPAGITRQVTARNAVIFGAACRDCPLRARCTAAKDGRTLHLHEHDSLLRAARADWAAGPELREDYMTYRPNVERVIAQVATCRGRRLKLRYRGATRNHAWLKRRTAALNLRNLLGRGLAYRHGAWVLAT
jgi:IS5 family transposase